MNITLEEAIIHAEEIVDRCEVTDGDRACAEAHRQLAEWLKELKAVKDLIRQHDEDSMPEDFWYIDEIREAVRE